MYEVLKQWIAESSRIVFFGGAGVSTESGIPDFRSENGLYNAEHQFGHSPEELVSYFFYKEHTDEFFDYYKHNLICRDALPNNAHKALAKLERQGKLRGIVTQNTDGLHQMAGNRAVYELHGSVRENTCTSCGAQYDLDYVMAPENCADEEGRQTWTPRCIKCGAVVKPDVVLYGESLDNSVLEGAMRALAEADLLIVGGTSLAVYPAAGLLEYYRGKHLVLINRSETAFDSRADLVIRDSIGKVLGECVLCQGETV